MTVLVYLLKNSPRRSRPRVIWALILSAMVLLPLAKNVEAQVTYTEPYRPQYHFSAPVQWLNDPCGMTYYEGKYHLFYQFHPGDTQWGPMHWGHAVSEDLFHWEHMPIALVPNKMGDAFTGAIVFDRDNTSGLGTPENPPLVAVYTASGAQQTQCVAYSLDGGLSWENHAANPLIPNAGIADFRDPRVFWHDSTQRWVLNLAESDHVTIYTSPDLLNWTRASVFGSGQGAPGSVWEVTDLFELPLEDGSSATKWILLASVWGAPNGGGGVQYFVGDFDGTTFTNDNPSDTILWIDYGKDNYAGATWSDIPASDGRRLYIAWMNNWEYASDTPTATWPEGSWRGSMTLPRELTLRPTPNGPRLFTLPTHEIQAIRRPLKRLADVSVQPGENLLAGTAAQSLEINANFLITQSTASAFGFTVLADESQRMMIRYDVAAQKLEIVREGFRPSIQEAPLTPVDGAVSLQIFVDRSSIEIFANNGALTMTSLTFNDNPTADGLGCFASDGAAFTTNLDVFEIASTWAPPPEIGKGLTHWEYPTPAWLPTDWGMMGMGTGDRFALASQRARDFTLKTEVKIFSGAAVALVFRSNDDASDGLVATLDISNQLLKLWRIGHGELAAASVSVEHGRSYRLQVNAKGRRISVSLDGALKIDRELDAEDATPGDRLGLNVFNAAAIFIPALTSPISSSVFYVY